MAKTAPKERGSAKNYAWPTQTNTRRSFWLRYARPDPERWADAKAALHIFLRQHRYRVVSKCLSKA